MLGPEEIARAEALALDATEVYGFVGAAVNRDERPTGETGAAAATGMDRLSALSGQPSYRVLYTQRYADKAAPGRAAEVLIYRYDTNEAVLAMVDLVTNEVEAR